MRNLIFILLFPVCLGAQADHSIATNVEWSTDYENALKASKEEKKNILVYFTGSDWCPPCKMLESDFFDSEDFLRLSNRYVLLYIDMPRNKDVLPPDQMKQNQRLLANFNKKGIFPLLKVLDDKGSVLDEYAGYKKSEGIQHHLEMLEKHKN